MAHLTSQSGATGPADGAGGDLFGPRDRTWIVCAALLALFLGAMDALVMTAAMPTIVADLGGLPLYSWVYSVYFLARAVALPIFGKLADRYPNRALFLTSISIFLVGSVLAGLSGSMGFLIGSRVVQGIGAGGNFAMVYIVLSDVSAPETRGRTLSFASSIWGLASVLGPTLGAVIVTYVSWRWIFFINLPLGGLSMIGLGRFLKEMRPKAGAATLDIAGVTLLTVTILALLTAFLLGGRQYEWGSPPIVGLLTLSILAGILFYRVERAAPDPILAPRFLAIPGFRTGNLAVFLSSFAIFSLFAFAPLFLQDAQARTPMQVGWAMLSLSLGWSIGSLALGQVLHRIGKKPSAVAGGLLLASGSGATLLFAVDTAMPIILAVFLIVGIGMGFVTLSTLLVVQDSMAAEDLGVATSAHQFARTLGGAVGIGICGSMVTAGLSAAVEQLERIPLPADVGASLTTALSGSVETLFRPEIQARLPEAAARVLRDGVLDGVTGVFATVLGVSLLCAAVCMTLPGRPTGSRGGTPESG